MKTIFTIIVALFAITVNAQVIKRGTYTSQLAINNIDSYHESDDLLLRNSEYIIYMNRTSPTTDTLYVYRKITETVQCKAIGKNKTRCKLRTAHASGLCHVHLKR